uniref:Uncharacterized protein n=1 Tax=mine drainage metagenome TaxID=410659 RepID=E6QX25_9ZZZZ
MPVTEKCQKLTASEQYKPKSRLEESQAIFLARFVGTKAQDAVALLLL